VANRALNADPNGFAREPATPPGEKPERGRPQKTGPPDGNADRAFSENLADLERRATAALEGEQAETGKEPPVKKRGGKRKGGRGGVGIRWSGVRRVRRLHPLKVAPGDHAEPLGGLVVHGCLRGFRASGSVVRTMLNIAGPANNQADQWPRPTAMAKQVRGRRFRTGQGLRGCWLLSTTR
jgi:hypothetical protein